jgi:hypothetical protein
MAKTPTFGELVEGVEATLGTWVETFEDPAAERAAEALAQTLWAMVPADTDRITAYEAAARLIATTILTADENDGVARQLPLEVVAQLLSTISIRAMRRVQAGRAARAGRPAR